MFGGKSTKMSKVRQFEEYSIVGKSIAISSQGKKTEDTKFYTVDFDELLDPEIQFVDSEIFEYFTNRMFLFMVLQEQNEEGKFKENRFLGFKRLWMDQNFIYCDVQNFWLELRATAFSGQLKTTYVFKKDGTPRLNPNGLQMRSTNFPKSKTNKVFLRGTGATSEDIVQIMPNVETYKNTQVWIKGDYLVQELEKCKFL